MDGCATCFQRTGGHQDVNDHVLHGLGHVMSSMAFLHAVFPVTTNPIHDMGLVRISSSHIYHIIIMCEQLCAEYILIHSSQAAFVMPAIILL